MKIKSLDFDIIELTEISGSKKILNKKDFFKYIDELYKNNKSEIFNELEMINIDIKSANKYNLFNINKLLSFYKIDIGEIKEELKIDKNKFNQYFQNLLDKNSISMEDILDKDLSFIKIDNQKVISYIKNRLKVVDKVTVKDFSLERTYKGNKVDINQSNSMLYINENYEIMIDVSKTYLNRIVYENQSKMEM